MFLSFSFSSSLKQTLLIGFVALLLTLGVIWAVLAGISAGKSSTVLKNAAALDQGLAYFFADQNRYPTGLEFQNRNLMLNYFSTFPPATIAGGKCSQTYQYSNPTAKSFELDFCLPKAVGGFAAGWNKVTQ
jgi:hypothetical protein